MSEKCPLLLIITEFLIKKNTNKLWTQFPSMELRLKTRWSLDPKNSTYKGVIFFCLVSTRKYLLCKFAGSTVFYIFEKLQRKEVKFHKFSSSFSPEPSHVWHVVWMTPNAAIWPNSCASGPDGFCDAADVSSGDELPLAHASERQVGPFFFLKSVLDRIRFVQQWHVGFWCGEK